MENRTDRKDPLAKVNEQLAQGEIVVTDEKILEGEKKEQKPYAVVTGASISTVFRLKTEEYLKKKAKSKE